MELLLSRGAMVNWRVARDENDQCGGIRHRESEMGTALHAAAANGGAEAARFLLDHGTDLHIRSRRWGGRACCCQLWRVSPGRTRTRGAGSHFA